MLHFYCSNMSIYILFLLLINLNKYTSMLLRGKRVHNGQFPWLLQFQTIAPCGGVLLSSDWVLTAAQCVQDKRNSIILFATGLNGTGSKQTISVKATYIYPHYEAYSILPDRSHNIALLKLIEPFDMSNTKIILPTVLPVSYDNKYTSCLIFGWQSYVSPSSKVFAKPIQYSEVILNSWKLCTYMIKTNVNYTNVFCAMVEFKDEMKACAGNPGSPVICENQYREIAVLGIASWTNFSLECGNLPTYLDLGAFRMWMYDLIFNNEKTKEWERNEKSSRRNYNFRDNIEILDNSWNDTDLQQNYWSENTRMWLRNISVVATIYQETTTENMNKSHFWNKLHLTVLDNFNDTNVPFSYSYHDIPYANILQESNNGIYSYEEIGKIKNSQNQGYIVDNLNKHEQFNYPNKSLLCDNKNLDKTTMEPNKDRTELNGFEFLLPYNFEDIITSYSSITTISSKNLYFLLFCTLILLWYYYLHVTFHL